MAVFNFLQPLLEEAVLQRELFAADALVHLFRYAGERRVLLVRVDLLLQRVFVLPRRVDFLEPLEVPFVDSAQLRVPRVAVLASDDFGALLLLHIMPIGEGG